MGCVRLAITWGSWDTNARVGVEAVRSSSTTSAETWTVRAYLERRYTTTWDQTGTSKWTLSGAVSGSGTISVASGGSLQILLATKSVTINKAYGSTQSKSVTLSVTKFSSYNPGSVTVKFTVAARAYSAPAKPSNVTGSYVAANKVKATWAKVATTGAPVSGFTVAIRREGGTWSYTKLGSSVTSWTSAVLATGYRYQVAVRQEGAGGVSAYVESTYVAVTPNAPSNVSAARTNTDDILVSWTGNSSIAGTKFEVWDGDTLVGSNISGTQWTHVAPSLTSAHQYRVREVINGLYSPYSAYSGTVQLLSAPLAPTDLSPNGGALPYGSTVSVSWEHNPVDTTAQTGFEVRYRLNSGSWTTLSGTTAAKVTLPVSTVASGTEVEYQVRTKGTHADFSPWSATASFTMLSRPSLTITMPTTVTSDSFTATLKSSVTSAVSWEAEIRFNSVVVQTLTGYGVPPIDVEVTGVPNGTSVSVRARIMTQVWSNWITSASRTVSYTPPATPVLFASWDSANAAVVLTVANPDNNTVPVVGNAFERRYDGGQWQLLTADPGLDVTVTDYTPALNKHVEYRVGASAETGVIAWSEPVTPTGSFPPAHYVNFGDGYGQVVVLRYNPEQTISPGLETVELVYFAGQSTPTALIGEDVSLSRTLGGTLIDKPGQATAREQAQLVKELAHYPGLVLVRTIDHDPVTGIVSGVKLDQLIWGGYQVSLTHTQAR